MSDSMGALELEYSFRRWCTFHAFRKIQFSLLIPPLLRSRGSHTTRRNQLEPRFWLILRPRPSSHSQPRSGYLVSKPPPAGPQYLTTSLPCGESIGGRSTMALGVPDAMAQFRGHGTTEDRDPGGNSSVRVKASQEDERFYSVAGPEGQIAPDSRYQPQICRHASADMGVPVTERSSLCSAMKVLSVRASWTKGASCR